MPQAVTTKDEALSKNAGGIATQRQANAKTVTPHVAANETTVSATLVDLGGNVWSGALITINFMPAPNIPGPYFWGGGAFSIRPRITADANGYFSISLPDNLTITPAGSMWQFVIAPAATMPAVIFQLMIAGASMDISAIFTSQSYQVSLGTVQSLPVPRAYADSDVATPPNTGQVYFNTAENQLKVFVSNLWQSGGAPYWASIGTSTATRIMESTDMNTIVNGGFYDVLNPVNGPPVYDPVTGFTYIAFQVWPSADPNYLIQMAWGMTEWGQPMEIWLRALRPDSSGNQVWTPWATMNIITPLMVDGDTGLPAYDLNNFVTNGTWVFPNGGPVGNRPNPQDVPLDPRHSVLEVFNVGWSVPGYSGPTAYIAQRFFSAYDWSRAAFYIRFYADYAGAGQYAWSQWWEYIPDRVVPTYPNTTP